MIKNKIWKLTLFIFLGTLVGFTSLNQSTLAMSEEDKEYNNAITVINKKRDEYKKLQNENIELRHSIEETDKLVTEILNSPITVFSFFSAVARRASNEEINKLFFEATHDIKISHLITEGTTSVNKEAFPSNLKLLELTKLLNHTTVSEKYATITYRTLLIKGRLPEEINKQTDSLIKTMKRNDDNVSKKINFEDELISETEDIKVVIQKNTNESSIPLTSLPPFTQPQDPNKN